MCFAAQGAICPEVSPVVSLFRTGPAHYADVPYFAASTVPTAASIPTTSSIFVPIETLAAGSGLRERRRTCFIVIFLCSRCERITRRCSSLPERIRFTLLTRIIYADCVECPGFSASCCKWRRHTARANAPPPLGRGGGFHQRCSLASSCLSRPRPWTLALRQFFLTQHGVAVGIHLHKPILDHLAPPGDELIQRDCAVWARAGLFRWKHGGTRPARGPVRGGHRRHRTVGRNALRPRGR